jgi:hypothetical protein
LGSSKRLEDRIFELIAKAVATSDDAELEEVINELREGLAQHIRRVRKLAVTPQPALRRRKGD